MQVNPSGLKKQKQKTVMIKNEYDVEVWKIPVQVFVAFQVLQFHSLDLVVVQMKLMETIW